MLVLPNLFKAMDICYLALCAVGSSGTRRFEILCHRGKEAFSIKYGCLFPTFPIAVAAAGNHLKPQRVKKI